MHTEQELDKAQETTSNLRLEVAKFKSMLQDAEKSIVSLTQEADNAKKDKYEAEEGLTKQQIQVIPFLHHCMLLICVHAVGQTGLPGTSRCHSRVLGQAWCQCLASVT